MQKLYCLLLACCTGVAAAAQFSKAVKDSVAAQMYYPSPRYEITLGIDPADYIDKPVTVQQTDDSLKGHYKDAPVLATLSFTALEKEKNLVKANEYLTKAFQQYEAWVNAEPENPEPVANLAALAMASKNYQLAPKVLEYGLQKFPRHLHLLQTAAHYYTLVANEFATAQVYISQALELDSLNIVTLMWQTMLHKTNFINMLQKGGAATMPAGTALDRALQRQPGNAAFQHLAWFRQLVTIFFEGLMRSYKAQASSMDLFEHTGITPAENNLLEKAKIWFQQQAGRQDAAAATAMSTLGVIACLQRDYEKAGDWFYKSYKVKTNMSYVLGSAVLCRFFLKDYAGAARLLEEKTAASDDALDYGAHLKIY
jgi:tetratricopeptide (TPR) repeat protein